MTAPARAAGGTEILVEQLQRRLPPELLGRVNLMVNAVDPARLDPSRPNVLWNHHSPDQAAIANLRDPALVARLERIVFVSHWQFEKYRMLMGVPEHKCTVLKNAIEEMEPGDPAERSGPLRLVYASTPWRGLDVLLESFERLRRPDVELHVYSSTQIYGPAFHRANAARFEPLFERARAMPGVVLHGYSPNAEVRQALRQADILAYPCTWEETSCLVAIEAAMAGCLVVTTNLGALPETMGEWAVYTGYDSDPGRLATAYARTLAAALQAVRHPVMQQRLALQHQTFRMFYGWQRRAREWAHLLQSLG